MSETKATLPKISEEEKELQKQNRELKRQLEEAESKLMSVDRAPEVKESNETLAVMENLRIKLEALERAQQVQTYTVDGKKPKYRTVMPEDILPTEESVTFTARCTNKVIPGYLDQHGREILCPHKMIMLKFAASDIRQDGKEQDIINFCTYSTHLKSEIEFLRNHPEFGYTFSDNMNEVAGHDPKEYQFRTKAAEQIGSMSPESVVGYAEMLRVPGWQSMSNKQLKGIILDHLVKEFKQQANDLQDKLKEKLLSVDQLK